MVFTGLVQAVGRAVFDTSTNKLHVQATQDFWAVCVAGDSIAVNGCCLTILASTNTPIGSFFVMEETRNKTAMTAMASVSDSAPLEASLATDNTSTPVNLEKALKVGDPLGGHTIAGHVDGTAPVVEIQPHEDGSRSVWIELNEFDSRTALVVPKGSIALDGVSLTVAELSGSRLRVSLIPHTLKHTNLQYIKVGDRVNVEFDQALKMLAEMSPRKDKSTENVIQLLPEAQKNAKDEEFMSRAIELGECGKPTAPPNPWVGCVITDAYGEIIGEGFHKKAGTGHAEVVAIQNAIAFGFGDRLEGSTAYVTLEPCSHYGRTPPCDQLLIKHKIARVVVALTDPDKKVSGTGLQHLKDAGIRVTTGVMAQKAADSLRSYLHHRKTGLPWVVFKIATSLDGKIAAPDGTSKWITGPEARMDCHQRFRATSQAIIVGSKTAEQDDPQLTVRALPSGSDASQLTQPLRVVVGNGVKLCSNLLDTKKAPTMICITQDALVPSNIEGTQVQVLKVPSIKSRPDFRAILVELGKRDILQVLVEGGATFGSSILHAGLVNQFVIYQAPIILGVNSWDWSQTVTCDTMPQQKSPWKFQGLTVLGNNICTEYLAVQDASGTQPEVAETVP